jgi:hypothetical protein
MPVGRPRARLSEKEFVEVYVKLSRATTPQAKAAVLKQHGTTEAELQQFIQVHLKDLPALSTVFDSLVARMGSEQQPPVPALPIR